jgi:hypothetical protein
MLDFFGKSSPVQVLPRFRFTPGSILSMFGGEIPAVGTLPKPVGDLHSPPKCIQTRSSHMEKEITIAEFAEELKTRLQAGKTVDCCKDELLRLADIISAKIGEEKILVSWKP